jgi:hydrogenase-4 membrane subunit HyfE
VSYLLLAFLLSATAPLFLASWRPNLAALGLQGFVMAALLLERGFPATASGAVLLFDLLVVRAWLAPRYLWGILREQTAHKKEAEVIPASLLAWSFAGVAVILAFQLAEALAPDQGDETLRIAVAAAGLLLGFLLLAAHDRTFAQLIGALRIENAVALFELDPARETPLPVQLGLTLALVLSIGIFGQLLRQLGPTASASAPPGGEEPR